MNSIRLRITLEEKVITKKLEQEFLRYMYARQIAKCGHGISKREDSKMYTTHGPRSGIEDQIPGILVDLGNGLKKYLLTEVAIELKSKGLVEFNANNTEFWLSVAGYEMAAKNRWERALDFLNKNPGLIAGISLVVAVGAFVVSVVAYIHPPATAAEPAASKSSAPVLPPVAPVKR